MMEKYAVEEENVPKDGEKQAGTWPVCPKCGSNAVYVLSSKLYLCKHCGSEPFERNPNKNGGR